MQIDLHYRHSHWTPTSSTMMSDAMELMMGGAGLIWILVVVALVLGIVALVKYLKK